MIMASVVALAGLLAGLLAGDAWAEPTKADRLFLEGRELLKAGEIEEACKKSDDLTANPESDDDDDDGEEPD